MVTQGQLDGIHAMLCSGRMTRRQYFDVIKSLNIPINKNLKKRMDDSPFSGRTVEEFALFIHDNTVRERFLLEAYLKMRGRENYIIENAGIANDGRLILDTTGIEAEPDFRVWYNGRWWNVEVKFNPVTYKQTFKKLDLDFYLEFNAQVLLIMGRKTMIGPNGDPDSNAKLYIPRNMMWACFGSETIQNMIDDFECKKYKEIGYKFGIQLLGANVNTYLAPKAWNYASFKMAV